jgi:hypothetical protein
MNVSASSQTFFPFPTWQCTKKILIFGRHLLPPSKVVKFASLMGLGAFGIVKAKEAAVLL